MFRWVVAAIVTIAVLVVVGSLGDRAATDTELAVRIGDRLAAEGIGWVETEVTGRNVRIVGGAASREERDKALTVVRSTPGVREVTDETEVLAAASPYGFAIARQADATIVKGHLPNSQSLQRIKQELAATFPTGLDDAGLDAASGAPANFVTAVEATISAAELLATGTASIDGTIVKVEGVANDEDDYEALTAGGKITVPQGYTLAVEKVAKPDPVPAGDGGATAGDGAPASQ
ncbi:hypothetical protein ACSSVZ_003704 [Amorphus sp. MBR-141]